MMVRGVKSRASVVLLPYFLLNNLPSYIRIEPDDFVNSGRTEDVTEGQLQTITDKMKMLGIR